MNTQESMVIQEGWGERPGSFVTTRKRFIIITRFLILSIVAVLAAREAMPEHLRIIFPILLVFLASNVFFLFQPAQRFEAERISGWIFVFDTFFVSVFVFYLQARTTEFYLVYFLTIFIAASAKSAVAAIGTSLIIAIIYGVLTKYEKTGVALYSVSFFMRVVFFFVTAMVVGYLAEQVKKEREAREFAQRMLRLSRRLGTLFDVSQKIVSTEDLDQLTRQLFDSAVGVLQGDSGSLMLLDETTNTLSIKESVGLSPQAGDRKTRLGEGIAGVVAKEGKAVLLCGDVSDDPRYNSVAPGRRIAFAICAPLRIGKKTLGVINVNRCTEKSPFTNEDLQLLVALANHAATVLEKMKLHECLANAYDASKRRYETLVNTANAAIFVTDSSGCISFINKQGAQMLGHEASELDGHLMLENIHPEDVQRFTDALRQVTKKQERVMHLEYRVRSDGKDWRHHSVSCAPLEDMAGGECSLLGVAEDITDYVLLQKHLAQSAKLASVGTMVSGIAHELNNPLVGVIGFAEILREREDIRQLAGHELDMILRQAERCGETVRGLLRFARQEEATKDLVNINPILRDSLTLTRGELDVRNITLVEDYAEDLPAISADASQLQSVFLNILSNAIDAMSETHGKGRLSVRTWRDDHRVFVECADDGGGIREPEKIFDPFYTTKEVGKGTGLGLSISYGIVEEHGGRIEARNSGQGAVFTVTLPIAAAALEPKEGQGEDMGESRRASVLVIDDEEVALQVSRQLLEGMGHQIATARCAEEALERLDENDYDVILTDIRMPGVMDGCGFYEWVRMNRPDLLERIVFSTGDTLSPRVREFIRRTDVNCLLKPFRAKTFRETIEQALAAQPTAIHVDA